MRLRHSSRCCERFKRSFAFSLPEKIKGEGSYALSVEEASQGFIGGASLPGEKAMAQNAIDLLIGGAQDCGYTMALRVGKRRSVPWRTILAESVTHLIRNQV
jgi:hypothetical protein